MTRFEDAASEILNLDMVFQHRVSYNLVRIFDALRGQQNITSLSERTQVKINTIGNLLDVSDKPYKLPSLLRVSTTNNDIILLFCGQVYEIRTLDSIDWQNKKIIVYVADAWEPRLDYFSSLIHQYDINAVLCSYQESTNILSNDHENIYWLPQGIDPSLWRDYGLDKEHTAIQFGRKNPTLHKIASEKFGESYVHEYISGDRNLARQINKSRFCLVSPRILQDPDHTGDISPVTLRFYQALACKSMPAGFKPREFDDIFEDEIFMIEFETQEQFLSDIKYYIEHPDEYWARINRNYEITMSNHTWQNRAIELADIVQTNFHSGIATNHTQDDFTARPEN